jgi:probable nitrogen fixation protein
METQIQNGLEFKELFLKELSKQIRATDTYGTYDKQTDEMLFRPYTLTKEQKKAIPQFGDIDAKVKNRIQLFYNAIGAAIEHETGVMMNSLMDMSHEGFGRVIIYAGKLILVEKVLRDAHRFGYESIDKLAEDGSKLVSKGVVTFKEFEAVAKG